MPDVLIIGGGIAGLLTARELSGAGASVQLLERGEPARESSWAGGGILSPLYPWRYSDAVTALARWSQQAYPGICDELREATGIDPQYLASGLLIHAPDEEATALDWARRHGYEARIASRREIRELEPNRADPPETMLWLPRVAQVRNPRLGKALVKDLEGRGVQIRARSPVEALVPEGTGVRVVAGGRSISADAVVVCAGAWSRKLLEPLGTAPAIRPVRGQMLLFRTRPGLIRHMVLEEDRYIIPRKDGRVLFGSTLEEAGFEKTTTGAARQELHEIAVARFPVLADHPVERHWAGLRPGSPGGVPWIDRHPEHENLFISAGHYRNGVVLGPASARLVADLVLGREPVLDPGSYGFAAERPATP